jgi:hypothetical protein
MFLPARLPQPDPRPEDSVIDAANNLRIRLRQKKISRQISELEAATLVSVARAAFPKLNDDDAITKFEQVLEDALCSLEMHTKEFRRIQEAERVRLTPLMGAVNRRALAILEELRRVDFGLRSSSVDEVKIQKMKEAGMTDSEIGHFIDLRKTEGGARREALAAEREALVVEQAAIEKFIKSRYDEKYLPPGYEMPPPLHSDDSPGGTA